ncbi:MAG: transposase [Burkholderiaceae bacterium]
MTPVLQAVQRVLMRHLLGQAGLGVDAGQGGAVTLIQRFGSAANLNIHLHCLVLDGVHRRGADGVPVFIEARAPTDEQIEAVLLQTLITRLRRLLTRQGVLVQDLGETWLWLAEPEADGEEARTLRPPQAAALAYRIAFGPRAGHKVLTLRGARPRQAMARQPLCAGMDGFSLHAAVRCAARESERPQRLCWPGRIGWVRLFEKSLLEHPSTKPPTAGYLLAAFILAVLPIVVGLVLGIPDAGASRALDRLIAPVRPPASWRRPGSPTAP